MILEHGAKNEVGFSYVRDAPEVLQRHDSWPSNKKELPEDSKSMNAVFLISKIDDLVPESC